MGLKRTILQRTPNEISFLTEQEPLISRYPFGYLDMRREASKTNTNTTIARVFRPVTEGCMQHSEGTATTEKAICLSSSEGDKLLARTEYLGADWGTISRPWQDVQGKLHRTISRTGISGRQHVRSNAIRSLRGQT